MKGDKSSNTSVLVNKPIQKTTRSLLSCLQLNHATAATATTTVTAVAAATATAAAYRFRFPSELMFSATYCTATYPLRRWHLAHLKREDIKYFKYKSHYCTAIIP